MKEHDTSMPTVHDRPISHAALPHEGAPSPAKRPRGFGRALGMILLIGLLGFGGGIAGFFAADEWLAEDDAGISSSALPQPSNDTGADDDTTPVADGARGGMLSPAVIYDRVAPAVVHIEAMTEGESGFFGSEPDSTGTGSGFVIDTEGHIVTNAHVVDGAQELTVSFGDDITVPAKLVGEDTSTDLAVIKVDPDADELGALRTVGFGDSTRVKVGDPVVAIGNPFSLDRTLTTGVVSALQRDIPAFNEDYNISDVIQTDAAINPGNSGGPLLDMTGSVIGVNSQIQTRSGGFDGIAFAVPSSTVRDIADQLIKSGKVEHAWFGLAGGELTPELAKALDLPVKAGVLIGEVTEGSPADKAGLEAGARDMVIEGTDIHPGGDVILTFDGTKLTTMRQLAALVDGKKPGDEVKVEFLQDGRRKTTTVTLGNRPERAAEDK